MSLLLLQAPLHLNAASETTSNISTHQEEKPSTSSNQEKKKEESPQKQEQEAGEEKKEEKKEPEKGKEKKQEKKKSKEEEKKKEEAEAPWFIGTLLAQYGENIDPGEIDLSPSLILSRIYGTYNGKGELLSEFNGALYSLMLSAESGITKRVDITIDTGASWICGRDREALFHLIDTQIYLGFQLAKNKENSPIPDLRLLVGGNFPTGKFDQLNSATAGIDATGSGAYALILLLVWQKLYALQSHHPYKWNVNLAFFIPSSVHTQGISVYGGAPNVRGFAQPGNRYSLNVSYEYKFDLNWGWGFDLHYDHQDRSSFSTSSGVPEFSLFPSTDNLSFAPEIEYDFNENFGVMAGFWCTLLGRNSPAFFSSFFSLSYDF